MSVRLVTIGVAALVLVFALWWLYFLHPAGDGLAAHRGRSYLWGYGHYGVFAALAAVGAGLEVAVEQTGPELAASPVAIGYAVAVPVVVFLVLVWALHSPLVPRPVLRPPLLLGAGLLIVLLPLAARPAFVIAAIALICAGLVASVLWLAESESP